MGLRVITGPAYEPVTIAEVRAHTIIENTLLDATLAGFIIAARQWIEQRTGRALITQTLELTLDDFPRCGVIELPRGPVASVTSISYVDTTGQPQSIAAGALTFDGLSWPPRVAPAYGSSWPQTRRTLGNVAVRFIAGEVQAPEPLRLAISILAANWNENREKPEDNPAVMALIADYGMLLL